MDTVVCRQSWSFEVNLSQIRLWLETPKFVAYLWGQKIQASLLDPPRLA
jgi:hypothetical protein